MLCDRIWRNARLATLSPDLPGLGMVEDGLIACSDGVIQFAGSAADATAGDRQPDLVRPTILQQSRGKMQPQASPLADDYA